MTKVTNLYGWGHPKRYNDFSTHFRKLFNERVQKVSVDAGFTCPNRDGTKGTGGCTYCNNKTFKPSYCDLKTSVKKQVEEGILFFGKKYESMKFLAYFQAYTNTYAPLSVLSKLYEEALENSKVVGLVVATRPDCLSDEILDYFQELSKSYYVMVELGIESCENQTLQQINRGTTFEESARAIEQLAERGIHRCAHLILGLPGEERETILKQARTISELPIENIKIHQLQIHADTLMAKEYLKNPELFHIYSVNEFIELVIDYIELLRPSIIIERFVSESPADLLIAPNWGLKNYEFVAKVEKRLKERDTWQGKRWRP
ncbi:MAG TPA: TIGR01212 family radical SAM protein [Prolixibacteraceae bacterium]|nr:TIGR01212 family radical SAM protein [Prolixibacteraceae bacterium]HPS14026.1 TIGR01212 family radical SAM protein [Prolixibacteraceae bacterium]